MSIKLIEHTGIVKEIKSNRLIINIISESACSACHANGACNLTEKEEKEIEIFKYEPIYSVGDKVTVYYQQSLGNKAVFLGYILPFLILISTLLITYKLTLLEDLAGLLAILSLIFYYVFLYVFKHKISSTFTFSLKKR